jgi:folate-binding protein YgfZ
MQPLVLHEYHLSLGAQFTELGGCEAVDQYGDWLEEYAALRECVGVLDLSFCSRICLTGADRVRFLHGQVTNDVNRLRPGQGCYAALITAKGRMQSDLNIFCLQDELLLDFEPGLTQTVSTRLEKYVIADDVQVVDVAPHYGLLSVQGPQAEALIQDLGIVPNMPVEQLSFVKVKDPGLGESYLMNNPRLASRGFDLFVPTELLGAAAVKLCSAARSAGGRACGWQAFEVARIEAGIPRFGLDMDETNLPLEAGLESRAISFSKGCYIGQEVISRIRTYSQVAKALRGLRLADHLRHLPKKGDKLFQAGKEAGYITSAAFSPALKANLALGYVRKESNEPGTELTLRTDSEEIPVQIAPLPFTASSTQRGN